MGSSFTLEDPFRATQYDGMKTSQKAKLVFKDMGKGMWRQGKGFGMVGALYAGTECVVEGVSSNLGAEDPLRPAELSFVQYRAKNDIYNSVYAGLISGAVLGRNSGTRAMILGGESGSARLQPRRS